MSSTTTRVNYFERQFLRTQDFKDEQAYHLAQSRRHNITQHTWGIVFGLEIKLDPADKIPVLEPGVAIDAYGRLLIVPVRRTLGDPEFEKQGSEVIEIWLNYAHQESEDVPTGYVFCDDEANPYRLQEVAQVWVQAPDRNQTPDPNPVTEYRIHPDSEEPDQVTTDEPLRQWPVYLGSVTRIKGKEVTYQIELSGRPYAGLVGESVRSASGKARLQIGLGSKVTDQRFGVYLLDDKENEAKDKEASASKGDETKENKPILSIDKEGNTTLRANTTVQGNVRIKEGTVEFGVGTAYTPNSKNVRANFLQYKKTVNEGEETEAEETFNELRIEMPERSGNTPVSVIIGKWDKDIFVPCLTIEDTGTVIVHGNLVVENAPMRSQDGSPVQVVTRGFTQEAQAFLSAAAAGGGMVGLNSIVLPKKKTSDGSIG
jgi:hypothetical protein